jgi:hypothetical protein
VQAAGSFEHSALVTGLFHGLSRLDLSENRRLEFGIWMRSIERV